MKTNQIEIKYPGSLHNQGTTRNIQICGFVIVL